MRLPKDISELVNDADAENHGEELDLHLRVYKGGVVTFVSLNPCGNPLSSKEVSLKAGLRTAVRCSRILINEILRQRKVRAKSKKAEPRKVSNARKRTSRR